MRKELIVIGIVLFLSMWLIESKSERELRLFGEAAVVCGVENVKQVGYTNGENKFDCSDYKKAYEESLVN